MRWTNENYVIGGTLTNINWVVISALLPGGQRPSHSEVIGLELFKVAAILKWPPYTVKIEIFSFSQKICVSLIWFAIYGSKHRIIE